MARKGKMSEIRRMCDIKTGQADFKRFWNKQMDNKRVAYYRKDFV